MSKMHAERAKSLVVQRTQAVIAIPLIEDGREMDIYTVETSAEAPATLLDSVQDALSLAGAWSDLDWDETVESLDRIRHESRPTPPIKSIDV